MKKTLSMLVALIGLGLMLIGCGGANLSPEVQTMVGKNESVYTQLNMHMNPSRGLQVVETTNYGIGILIPVNSQVSILKVSSNSLVFDYNGVKVTLINKANYTGQDISQTIERYFGKKKVDLSKFNSIEQSAIKLGQAKIGISKEATLISRGYPPAHATPSLDSDSWTFWKTRWDKVLVQFKNGKIVKITE